MTKTQAISALILAEVAKGASVREALDAICGAGSFDRLAGDLWEQLNEGA